MPYHDNYNEWTINIIVYLRCKRADFVVVTILGFNLLWVSFGAQSEQKWETGVKNGIHDTFVPKHTQIAVEIVVNKIGNLTNSDTTNKIDVATSGEDAEDMHSMSSTIVSTIYSSA